ncbi:MAG: SDR family oxidoreductase, partial [Bacteroidetes bacterium]|nr:SDR family oxidoreductase [Bacteroidota bacterium]
LDICNAAEVQRVLHDFRPEVVIHTAAMTNVDACEMDHASCDALNVHAVEYLSRAAEEINARFIHLSTDFIFNGEAGPYDEMAAPDPLSYYGHSKLKGEQIVQSACTRWAILRTVLVYGIVHDMSRSNIVLWAKQALTAGKPLKVVDDQWRTPTWAEDLAMGCYLAEKHEAQGIYNISGADFMSVYELVGRVAAYYGLSMDPVERVSSSTLNQPAVRPPKTGFILDKARRDLGYAPHSFEEGIAGMDAMMANMQQP